jgi:5'-nucleotidase
VTAYAVDATPALAVVHAVTELASRRPSLVISGINFGANLGTEITISGTVGAALEAGALGIPAMAVSLDMDAAYHLVGDDSVDYDASMAFTHQFAMHLLSGALPHDVDALNVNIPSDATRHTPWRLTRVSRQRYYVPLAPDRANGEGRPGFSLMGDFRQAEADSDIRAVKVDRTVAVTPLSLDLTSRADFEAVGSCLGTQEIYLDVPELFMVGER